MSDIDQFDLGDKDDFLWVYMESLDRYIDLKLFSWVRVSYGQQYGECFDLPLYRETNIKQKIIEIKKSIIEQQENTFNYLKENNIKYAELYRRISREERYKTIENSVHDRGCTAKSWDELVSKMLQHPKVDNIIKMALE